MQRAVPLDHEGYVFNGMPHALRKQARAFLIEHLGLGRLDADDGGLIATDAKGELRGVLSMNLMDANGIGCVATIRSLAVDPASRGKGIGAALLALIPQFTEIAAGVRPDLTWGGCSVEAAAFYQRAGFDVLPPGERLPFGDVLVENPNTTFPCTFSRPW